MSEIEKRTTEYVLSVVNNEHSDTINWAFIAIMLGLVDMNKEKEN